MKAAESGVVLCVGEALVDLLGEGGDRIESAVLFRPAPGGAPANAAVAAARAGAPVRFAGCVGRDAFGRLLQGVLEGAGVDCAWLRRHPGRATTLAFVMPAGVGDLGFEFFRGADAEFSPEDLSDSALAGVAAVGCGGVALSAEPSRAATLEALRSARAHGALAVFDVNWRPRLWSGAAEGAARSREAAAACDVLKCNAAELTLLAGAEGDIVDRARGLLSHPDGQGPVAAAITLGEEGAVWVTLAGEARHPGFAVAAVDAVGAGDCFSGYLLAGLARSLAPAVGAAGAARTAVARLPMDQAAELLARCNAAAALSTTRPGGMGAMPSFAEVDAWRRAQGG